MNNFFMKKTGSLAFLIIGFLFQLMILQNCTHSTQLETVHHYLSLENIDSLSSSTYTSQLARFNLPISGDIVELQLHLEGQDTGTCTVHLYGHEGGISKPPYKRELMPTATIHKTKFGYELVNLPLPDSIFLGGQQFFVEIDSFTGQFNVIVDTTPSEAPCSGKDSGTFYPTYLNGSGKNHRLGLSVKIKSQSSPPIFEDITSSVGLPLNYPNRSIAWGDVNNDEWLDLLIGGNLFINRKGNFNKADKLLLVEKKLGIRGGFFIDMDNDRDQDILIFLGNTNYLFLNEGNEQFTRHALQLPPLIDPRGVSIADINGDQLPDMVVAQLWSKYPKPLPNYLFLNNGALGFVDISNRLYPNGNSQIRRSRGSQFTDYDLDGDQDLFIVNYFLEADEFYENDGEGNFKIISAPFTKDKRNSRANHGTGIDWYDYDNDGDFDLLLPHLAHPKTIKRYGHQTTTIFRNDLGKFTDLKDNHGIAFEETHAGAAFGDVNNDGLVDLVTTVFYPCRYISFYLQQEDHTFKLNTHVAGLANISTGNDACFVDYNNDGLLDLAMGKDNQFRLFKNVGGQKNNWIKIKAVGKTTNQLGIGAIVKIHTKQHIYTQEINAGRGQLMQKPAILHFGLNQEKRIKKVEVQWTKDNIEIFNNIYPNRLNVLQEGEGAKLQ